MWLDSDDGRNAIRAGLSGPLGDRAMLDRFWPVEPECSTRPVTPSRKPEQATSGATVRKRSRPERQLPRKFCQGPVTASVRPGE